LRIAPSLVLAILSALSVTQAQAAKRNDAPTYSNFLSARQAGSELDFKQASQYYEASLADDPDNADILSEAFRYQASSGDIAEAAKLGRRLIAVAPADGLAQFAKVVMMIDAIRRGRYDEATQLTKKPDGKTSGNLVTLLLGTWAQVGAGDTEGALASLRILKAGGAADVLADYHTALVLDLAGRVTDADAAYRKAMLASPSPRIVNAYGRFLERNDRAADAAALYSKLASENALSPVVNEGLARLAKKRKPDRMVSDARQGAAEAMFGVGSSLTDNSTFELAIIYLHSALYLRPDLDLATILLADRFETIRKYNDALALYRQVSSSSPYYSIAGVQIAIDLARLKKYDEAVSALKQLTSANPGDVDAWTALGDVYRTMERNADATEAYTQALKATPTPNAKTWPLYYSRAISEQQTNDWPAAEKDLQTALKLSPDEPDVLNNLGYSWVELRRNIPQALAMLEKARTLRPFDGYIIDSVGWAYYRLGKYDDAAKTLLNAVLLVPGDPTINEHLGDAYWRVGKKLDAQFQWNHALAFATDDKVKPLLQEKLRSGLPTSDPAQ